MSSRVLLFRPFLAGGMGVLDYSHIISSLCNRNADFKRTLYYIGGEKMKALFSVPEGMIIHNTKIKEYPNGDYNITVASRAVFKEKGYELSGDKKEKTSKPKNPANGTREDSLRRSKTAVSDIIRLNDFDYFVTLTLSEKEIDRTSPKDIIKKLRIILSNLVERYSLCYILVPEYHKDGKSIHFHGFISGNVKTVNSGTVKAPNMEKPIKIETAKRKNIRLEDCKPVYNLPQWKLGFNTAIPITQNDRDNTMLEKYVTKYITKDLQKIFGKYYLSGGSINRKAPVSLTDTDFISFESDDGKTYYCTITDTCFKYSDTRSKRLAEISAGACL